jgi:hypothetical protein
MISRTAPIFGAVLLFSWYQAKAVHTVYLMVGDPALTEAIVQIAFLRWQKDCTVFEVIFMGQEIARSNLVAVAESLK